MGLVAVVVVRVAPVVIVVIVGVGPVSTLNAIGFNPWPGFLCCIPGLDTLTVLLSNY